ncbi:unnamed protein product [Rodentolepis nana]|uniref:Ig-like domain-containing protein n=1 Tax=Rodentolepis nana TaxID=102285 RepID=A0A0R3TUN7_RODNA|nr:unnamed protein product [Rodentolepis nana]
MGVVTPGISDHLRSSWFPLLILTLLLIPKCSSLPHFYQVNMRLNSNDPLLELRCPLYQAVSGDVLIFSNMQDQELLRVVLQENSPPPVLALPIDSLSKDARAFAYVCRVFEPKTNSLVSKTTFAVQKQVKSNTKGVPVYETFHYEPEEVKTIKATIDKPLKVECPVKGGNHVWFRAGGEMILSPENKERMTVLNIISVQSSDLGTYYCASLKSSIEDEEKEDTSVGLLLPVQKFVVMAQENSVLTRSADVTTNPNHSAVQSCGDVVKELTPSDMITWERPLGTVHLVHSGRRQLNLKSVTTAATHPYHCSLEGHTIQRILTPSLAPLVRSRRSLMSK